MYGPRPNPRRVVIDDDDVGDRPLEGSDDESEVDLPPPRRRPPRDEVVYPRDYAQSGVGPQDHAQDDDNGPEDEVEIVSKAKPKKAKAKAKAKSKKKVSARGAPRERQPTEEEIDPRRIEARQKLLAAAQRRERPSPMSSIFAQAKKMEEQMHATRGYTEDELPHF